MLNFAPIVDAVILCKAKVDEEFIKKIKGESFRRLLKLRVKF